MCVDTGHFETFNRANVTLVDTRATPILELTAEGVRTGETDYGLDTLVFATCFDAMTGALNNIDIHGRGHISLTRKWLKGPRTYLGVTIEATKDAEDTWVAHVDEVGGSTLCPLANSWYMGANVPGKPRVFILTSVVSGPTGKGARTWRGQAMRVLNFAGR